MQTSSAWNNPMSQMKMLLCTLSVGSVKDKNEGDAFFIGISIREEGFYHRTRSQ